jgi:hypothetical protein
MAAHIMAAHIIAKLSSKEGYSRKPFERQIIDFKANLNEN